MIRLRFLGQSCFTLETGEETLVFDPWLTGNPAQAARPEDLRPTFILVSHGHADHLGDAVELAKENRAAVIATAEVGRFLAAKGCETIEPMHIGGAMEFPFGRVKLTPAFHGCGIAGGMACGFLVTTGGVTVYFAGDTGLFGDMKLIGARQKIDYALLPIGDRFTMGPEDAVTAASLLGARYVIPMHYNGNERTRQDPKRFAELLRSETESRPIILAPGEAISLEPAKP